MSSLLKRAIGLIAIASLAILLFLVEEGWIIGLVAWLKLWAIPVVSLVLFVPTLVLTRICELSSMRLPESVLEWLKRWKDRSQEKALSRLEKAANSAFWLVTAKTAILISPSVASIMLYLKGIRGKEAVRVNLALSIITAVFWCLVYSGAWDILRRILS